MHWSWYLVIAASLAIAIGGFIGLGCIAGGRQFIADLREVGRHRRGRRL